MQKGMLTDSPSVRSVCARYRAVISLEYRMAAKWSFLMVPITVRHLALRHFRGLDGEGELNVPDTATTRGMTG